MTFNRKVFYLGNNATANKKILLGGERVAIEHVWALKKHGIEAYIVTAASYKAMPFKKQQANAEAFISYKHFKQLFNPAYDIAIYPGRYLKDFDVLPQINEVTALSKAFAIAIPHEQALDAKDEIGFFQAVKSRLQKFDTTGSGTSDDEIESAIRQVIDKALVSEGVIDVFDAAGIKKPDISILSDDFLMEIKDMEHKNLALETLKKLLNDEIKSRAKTNLIQSKSLMEMLENSIKKYQNKIITAAEVIEELIELANSIKNKDKADKDTGLTNEELACYYAIAENESAKEVLGNDVLRELAVYLSEVVKNNATIDWTIKESVRAKLKVMVKRALRKFGYPPDLEKLATENILKQAALLADELTTYSW